MPWQVSRGLETRFSSCQRQHPDDLTTCHQLAQIDLCLSMHFVAQKKLDESRSSLLECLENVERVLQQHPQDWSCASSPFPSFLAVGFAFWRGREKRREPWSSRAGRRVRRGVPAPLKRDFDVIKALAIRRWSFAHCLSRQGNDERAKSMILANLRMLDDVPNDDGNPFTATWRTLVRLDLHQFKACLPSGTHIPRE